MGEQTWQKIETLFHQAAHLPANERGPFLAGACGQDDVVRCEVESLLSHDRPSNEGATYDTHLQLRAYLPLAALQDLLGELPAGTRIGAYEIREFIAAGGMGDVYHAARTAHFEKEVAIKVVKRGLDTKAILRRFEQERQILANLDHPNIARLLDGGATDEGRPYLVMEYIEGRTIMDYCWALKLAERLQLFRSVCAAVQYAHQNLVVHRDLKASNILVTADGVPKLLDFGIAKLLEARADASRTCTRMLTPECASPEQVRGQPVTTATDIYSLGVLLYELLAGVKPYEFETLTQEEICRVVCFEDPRKPSLVAPLPRDLDNIVLKAMRKEPGERYASAQQLSEDIERHLTGLPVLARKTTFGYQLSKFVQRHKAGALAAVLVCVSLLAGMGATLWEAHVAQSERARAERRFDDVRKLASSLMFDIHDAVANLPGSLAARRLLVERALKYLDSLAREANGDPALQRDLAAAYERVGLVQGGTAYGSFGEGDAALKSFQKSLALRRGVTSSQSSTLQDNRALAGLLNIMGRLLQARGDFKSALDFHRQALSVAESLQKAAPNDPKVLDQLETSYDALGDLLSSSGNGGSLGQEQEATEIHRKGVATARLALKLGHNDSSLNKSLAIALVKTSDDFKKNGQRREALADAFEARDILVRLSSANPANATTRRLVAGMNSVIGDTQAWNGNFRGSLDSYTKALAIVQVLAGADPKNQQGRADHAICLAGVAVAQMHLGRLREAERGLKVSEQITQAMLSADPKNAVTKDLVAYMEADLGEVYSRGGKPGLALSRDQKALAIWQGQTVEVPNDLEARLKVASIEDRMGAVLIRLRRTDEAATMFRNALAEAEPLATANPPNQWALYVVADGYSGLGDLAASAAEKQLASQDSAKSWTEARSLYEKSANAWLKVHNPGAQNPGSFDSGNPAQVSVAVARCDSNLRKLGVGPAPR